MIIPGPGDIVVIKRTVVADVDCCFDRRAGHLRIVYAMYLQMCKIIVWNLCRSIIALKFLHQFFKRSRILGLPVDFNQPKSGFCEQKFDFPLHLGTNQS